MPDEDLALRSDHLRDPHRRWQRHTYHEGLGAALALDRCSRASVFRLHGDIGWLTPVELRRDPVHRSRV